ncbi:MAG TPA: zf-HC2 domain-containing protein, partial [Terriglobales bacterium]
MDHDVVVREKMTEKYLLNELDPEVRDQFEEHFFDCQECALDVRAAAEFVEQSKGVLAEERNAVPIPVPAPAPRPVPARLAWWQTV